MKNVEPYLHDELNINYWSPIPKQGNFNTFRIGITGKYIDVNINVAFILLTSIITIKSGSPQSFEGVYIRKYWEKQLQEKMPLMKIVFRINVEAKSKLWCGIKHNFSYMDWADELSRRLTESHMGSIDFTEFKKTKLDEVLLRVYEDSRETNELVKIVIEKIERLNG